MKRNPYTINGTRIRRRFLYRMDGAPPMVYGRFLKAWQIRKRRENGVEE